MTQASHHSAAYHPASKQHRPAPHADSRHPHAPPRPAQAGHNNNNNSSRHEHNPLAQGFPPPPPPPSRKGKAAVYNDPTPLPTGPPTPPAPQTRRRARRPVAGIAEKNIDAYRDFAAIIAEAIDGTQLTTRDALDGIHELFSQVGTSDKRDYSKDTVHITSDTSNDVASIDADELVDAVVNRGTTIRRFMEDFMATGTYVYIKTNQITPNLATKYGLAKDVQYVGFDYSRGINRELLTDREIKTIPKLRRQALSEQTFDETIERDAPATTYFAPPQ